MRRGRALLRLVAAQQGEKRRLKVRLNELNTIQIVCILNGCNTVIEIPLEKLEKTDKDGGEIRCPMCGATLHASHYTALGELARSIVKIAARRKDLQVRFVIPQLREGKP